MKNTITFIVFNIIVFNLSATPYDTRLENDWDDELYSSFSSPPPLNDNCVGALDFGILYCGFQQSFIADPEATPDAEATGNCIDNTEPGQWYTFTTPNPMPYNEILLGAPWMKIEIFKSTSDCNTLEYVDCSSNFAFLSFEPDPDTKYYLLTTGGCYLYSFDINPITCGNTFFDLNFDVNNPLIYNSNTLCSEPSSVVPCENDHTTWSSYESGCLSNLFIEVSEYTGPWWSSADEISITVLLEDCATLASQYDVNGQGFVCNAMSGETLTLENIPSGTNLHIGFGSEISNIGWFEVSIL